MASQAPPPSSPAGVPPSGGGKYIVIAVLIVGGIGAAVGVKMCQEPEPPPIVYIDAAPPPTPTGRNLDDEVPLPPPTVEDAGVDAGKKVVVTQLSNQCDAKKCMGASSPELETALQARVRQAHRCYDTPLANDPTLRGKVTVAVRIGRNGQVCSAGIASNDMGSPQVAQCVTGYFRGASFPAPKGGCVDVDIPINFVPRQ